VHAANDRELDESRRKLARSIGTAELCITNRAIDPSTLRRRSSRTRSSQQNFTSPQITRSLHPDSTWLQIAICSETQSAAPAHASSQLQHSVAATALASRMLQHSAAGATELPHGRIIPLRTILKPSCV
jgi:hypothetical protein